MFLRRDFLMKTIPFFALALASIPIFSDALADGRPGPLPVAVPTLFPIAIPVSRLGGEFKFLDCHAVVTTDGITVEQTLQVNIITDALKRPVSIKGNYSFYNSTVGIHGSAVLSGPIQGRYTEEASGYSSLTLNKGKLNINAEGDIQLEKLYSIGFDSTKTKGGYYSTVAGTGSRYVGVTGCTVSNVALFKAVPEL
jgi:hypothetical protein